MKFFVENWTNLLMGFAFLAIYLAENRFPERQNIKFLFKHDFLNIGIGIFNRIAVPFLILNIGIGMSVVLDYTSTKNFGITNWLELTGKTKTIIALLLIDIWMYWWHRINHIVPAFWYFHKFHHADKQMNLSTAFRFHTGEILLSNVFNFFVFALIGVTPQVLLLFSTLLFLSIIFHHSNFKINKKVDFILRYFIVSPEMHRIHHSKIMQEANSNYSSLFPWWDKLFGTYVHRPKKPIEFGI